MTYFDPGNGNFLVVDGQIVERDALRIAEKIADYDDRLRIICLDPDDSRNPGVNDAPFIVIRERDDGTCERVLEAWTLDDSVVERVWAADNSKHDILAKLVAMEEAKKKEVEDKAKAQLAENNEMMLTALQNPKSDFRFTKEDGTKVKISDEGGVSYDNNKRSFN